MMFTPPLTPCTPAVAQQTSGRSTFVHCEPDELLLPPASMGYESFGAAHAAMGKEEKARLDAEAPRYAWREDMTPEERLARRRWLCEGRGRKGLRIVIVTENFLPKIDGVTRTLARLLEHLRREGHQCMLLGPGSGMDSYAGHPLVGTLGIPLVVYSGLKLNFLRPRFLRTIKEFQPDVVHFVDPVWLGGQTLAAMELGWAGRDWVSENGPAIGAGINGAVVASYHTHLATYAALFGFPRLEPILWGFLQWLHSRTMLTLCPSPSTQAMLHDNGFDQVRIWPRGVDLSQFSPSKRSDKLRASWGVGELESEKVIHMEAFEIGLHYQGRKASLPLTPPETPEMGPIDVHVGGQVVDKLPGRVVLLYVGRISWEKNIHLLLHAYSHLRTMLPKSTLPKLVFVGDGPARAELEGICEREGYDSTFMGQRVGEDLAQCFASADVFAFPSFTETFGQVVLEALASGLPVIGLDAQGTRDLVQDEGTGLLLRLPPGTTDWTEAVKSPCAPTFEKAAMQYASLLSRAVTDSRLRSEMGRRASTEGVRGFTWFDAMECCVDGYREAMRTTPIPRKASRLNRIISRPLAPRRLDTGDIWHWQSLLVILLVSLALYRLM